MMSFTKPTKGNSPITFKAMDPSTQEIMKINGKDTVECVPTEVKGVPVTVEIFAPGKPSGSSSLF